MWLNTLWAAGFFSPCLISHLQLSCVSRVNTCREHISCTVVIVTCKHSLTFVCTHIDADACCVCDRPSEFVRCFEAAETQLLSYFDVVFAVLFLSLSLTQGILQELYPSVPRGSLCQWETLVSSSLMTCLESCLWEFVSECVCLCILLCTCILICTDWHLRHVKWMTLFLLDTDSVNSTVSMTLERLRLCTSTCYLSFS